MNRSFLLLLLIAAPALLAQSPQQYEVTHTHRVGGDGRWDYIVPDAPNHRLFVGRQNRVMVIDMNNGRLIAEVTGINGAHGTALAPGMGHGFATSGDDSSIVMFDLKTYKTISRIPAAEDADAIIYDPASKRIFSFNGDANSSTVVNPRNGTRVTNIPLGGKPEYGQSARNGKVYVNLTDSSQIAEIDTKSLTVTRRWSTAPCKNPVSMAIDTRHQRLFSGCRSGVMAISDYKNGTVVATVPIGTGVDGAGYDPVLRDAYASNADGTLTVIHQDSPDSYRVIQSVQTAEGSRNMGLDPATHRIYIAGARFGPTPADSTAANPRRRAPMVPGSFFHNHCRRADRVPLRTTTMTTGLGLRAEPAGGSVLAVWYAQADAGGVRSFEPTPLNGVPQRDSPHVAPSRPAQSPRPVVVSVVTVT